MPTSDVLIKPNPFLINTVTSVFVLISTGVYTIRTFGSLVSRYTPLTHWTPLILIYLANKLGGSFVPLGNLILISSTLSCKEPLTPVVKLMVYSAFIPLIAGSTITSGVETAD